MTEERMFEIATAFAAFIDEHVSEADGPGADCPPVNGIGDTRGGFAFASGAAASQSCALICLVSRDAIIGEVTC